MPSPLANLVRPEHAPRYQEFHVASLRPIQEFFQDRRTTLRVTSPTNLSVLSLSPERESELSALMSGDGLVQVFLSVDKALQTIDEVSQFTKDKACRKSWRSDIFALKNLVLVLLWQQRPDLFVGCWQHTSVGTTQRCWRCDGTGDVELFGKRCPKCGGTGRWTNKRETVLTVLAIKGYQYSTTWHIPSFVTQSLLGTLPYGEDLVASQKWLSCDLRKVPVTYTPEQYEERRSFLAWFIKHCREQETLLYSYRH